MQTRILPIAIVLVSLTIAAASYNYRRCTKGEGPVVTQTFDVDAFTEVKLEGAFDVNIIAGNNPKVSITGFENLMAHLDVKVRNNVLVLDLKDGCYRNSNIVADVVMSEISGVSLSGSGNIKVGDFANTPELSIKLGGSGNVEAGSFQDLKSLELKLSGSGNIAFSKPVSVDGPLTASISGSGNIVTKGEARTQKISIAGSGDYEGFDLLTDNTVLSIAGSGDAKIHAANHLNAKIAGSGDVRYLGTPKVETAIRGSGSVRSKE